MKKRGVAIWHGIVYVSIGVRIWQVGDTKILLAYLSPIPLVFIGWGISWLLTPRYVREIIQQLTPKERESLKELVASTSVEQGRNTARKMGIWLPPTAVLSGFLYAFCGRSLLLFSLPISLLLLVLMPPIVRQGMRQRRKMLQLLADFKSKLSA